jgi:hypothetical protein
MPISSSEIVVDQNLAAAIASAWPFKLTDGTNTASITASGEIKVQVTQPLPAGTNVLGHVITDSGSTVSVSNFPATQAVTQSGSWTVSLATESIEIGTVDQGTKGSLANAWPVSLSDGTFLLGVTAHPVRTDPTGTTTQPISAASLPLPTGAATAALQTQPGVDIGDVTINNASGAAAVNIQDGGNSITVDGTFWQATQPVSAASLPLPTGASTAAKQPALGTAGTASADVISIQGISGMTPISVTPGTVSSATVTSNSVGAVAAVTLLASRAARIRAVIFNESGTLFVKAGSTASSTDYTWRLTANTELDVTDYTGILTAIKSSGTSNVQATDF